MFGLMQKEIQGSRKTTGYPSVPSSIEDEKLYDARNTVLFVLSEQREKGINSRIPKNI